MYSKPQCDREYKNGGSNVHIFNSKFCSLCHKPHIKVRHDRHGKLIHHQFSLLHYSFLLNHTIRNSMKGHSISNIQRSSQSLTHNITGLHSSHMSHITFESQEKLLMKISLLCKFHTKAKIFSYQNINWLYHPTKKLDVLALAF